MKKIILTLNHRYSVSSGVFAGLSDKVSMVLNKYGQYEYKFDGVLDKKTLTKFNQVDMMSDWSENEDRLSKKIFSNIKGIKYHKYIGYYTDLYAGYVNESTFRAQGTSGGFTTWILCELLRSGEVDAVIHAQAVDPTKNKGVLFKYKISKTEQAIRSGSKTRYYPMELSNVLRQVKEVPGRYAVVGISDFITELRLLCQEEEVYKNRIVYMIGLLNAHQKTAKYAEALGWQQGILPGDIRSVDFRVKNPKREAWDYQCKIDGYKNGKKVSTIKPMSEFLVSPWNMGFFKANFSDFTDNAFNELADVTLGDAWLPQYTKDFRGTNLVIVRNRTIARMIKKAILEGRIKLDDIMEKDVIASQGMLSHTIYDLPYRLYKEAKRGFVPKKRTKPSKKTSDSRRKIQDLRRAVVESNNLVYFDAVKKNDFDLYRQFVNDHIITNNTIYGEMDKKHQALFRLQKTSEHIRGKISRIQRKIRLRTRIRKILSIISNRQFDGAIITLNDDFNYGNVMQRYALQYFLKKHNKRFVHLTFYTRYLQLIRDKYIHNSLNSFVQKYIHTREYSPVASVGYHNYIVGSDQVWRNHGTDDLVRDYMPYWLNFPSRFDKNRISYAASFGVDRLDLAGIDTQLAETVRPFLSKFRAVSVREQSGLKLVHDITDGNVQAEVTLDPTLLLDKDDYSSLIDSSAAASEAKLGVFAYILDITQEKLNIAKQAAEIYDTKYQLITASPNNELVSVEEWLRGFRDSQFVVTDSFHGVVFSIINSRNFIVLANNVRGLTRVESLLIRLGISADRLINTEENSNFSINKIPPIDWYTVQKRLSKLRAESENWLLCAIED